MNSKFNNKIFILTRLFIYIFVLLGLVMKNLDYKSIFLTLSVLLVIYDVCDTYFKLKK